VQRDKAEGSRFGAGVHGLEEPRFPRSGEGNGRLGHYVWKAGELYEFEQTWRALLHVKVKPMRLVTPLSPIVTPEALVGMVVCSALYVGGRAALLQNIGSGACPRKSRKLHSSLQEAAASGQSK
jgi:hypothetical protein